MAFEFRQTHQLGEFLLFGSFLVIFVIGYLHAPDTVGGTVPKIVLIPAILLTVLRLILLFEPEMFSSDKFKIFDVSSLSEQAELSDEAQRSFSAKGTAKAIGLFLIYIVLIYAIGFTLSTGLFITILFYTMSDLSFWKSLVGGVICAVFVYVVFIFLLNVRPLDTYLPLLP